MNRTAAAILLVACGLGVTALILVLSTFFGSAILARIPAVIVLILFGLALLVSGTQLTRSAAIAYRLTPITQRIAQIFFVGLGSIALVLGIIASLREYGAF